MLTRLILFSVIWLAACTSMGTPLSETQPPLKNTPSPIPLQNTLPKQSSTSTFPSVSGRNPEETPTSNVPLISSEYAESARQDLAQRLAIAMDDIKVIAVIGQEFSTDAFYCRTSKERIAKEVSPEVISGYSILLNAAGGRYEYHASDQTVIFCRPLS